MIEENIKFEFEGKKSFLFSTLRNNIKNAYQGLTQKNVSPWYNLCFGKPLETTNFYGKKISYSGIQFDGSPKIVFWENYIEPFIEDIVCKNTRETTILCQKHEISNKLPLDETKKLLKIVVENVYHDMNRICPINKENIEQKKKN